MTFFEIYIPQSVFINDKISTKTRPLLPKKEIGPYVVEVCNDTDVLRVCKLYMSEASANPQYIVGSIPACYVGDRGSIPRWKTIKLPQEIQISRERALYLESLMLQSQ